MPGKPVLHYPRLDTILMIDVAIKGAQTVPYVSRGTILSIFESIQTCSFPKTIYFFPFSAFKIFSGVNGVS